MNLSTLKLFSLKIYRNISLPTMNTPKLKSFSNKRNESPKKSNSIFEKKWAHFLNIIAHSENPKIRNNIFTKKNTNNFAFYKLVILQTKKIDLEYSKAQNFCKDSFTNKIFLTSECDSNKVKQNIEKVNMDKNRSKGNIDIPYDLFRKNIFKSTFIIDDNKGNNNINFQQKKKRYPIILNINKIKKNNSKHKK